MKKNHLFTKTQLVSLSILTLIILIGTYIFWNINTSLTTEEKERIKHDEMFAPPSLLLMSILVAIAGIFVCLILVDPFKN